MTKIGIYSGTFDPVHAGHVAFAEEAMETCGLDEVIFLPESTPRNKQNVTSMAHRLALLGHAIGARPGLRVVALDDGQFTVRKTLPRLKEMFAGSDLVLLIGSDVVRGLLHGWPDVRDLLAQVSFAIGLRAGDTSAELVSLMSQLKEMHDMPVAYKIIVTSHAAAASSLVRQAGSGSGLHQDVDEYIRRHDLYR